MIANHIHDALGQVRRMQELILEKRLFRGYSGKARILSGAVALAGTAVLAEGSVPRTQQAQLTGWAVVLVVALVLNYASLFYWFLRDPSVRRNPLMLKPAIDAIPALAVGAVLSVALICAGVYNLLFGVWMCLYGLAQVAYRNSLPRGIYAVGIFYLICGAFCLLSPAISFVDPWPMGLVFCVGESAGGMVLIHRDKTEERDGAV